MFLALLKCVPGLEERLIVHTESKEQVQAIAAMVSLLSSH